MLVSVKSKSKKELSIFIEVFRIKNVLKHCCWFSVKAVHVN